jgi:hypothetical protein
MAMKSYIKILKTKREVAELMIRPLNLNVPAEYICTIVEKIMLLPEDQFLREARKSTDLNIVPFLNQTYFIRYEID